LNQAAPKLRILVAPLDWGLGHATRCIPIIRELLAQNVEVILAADKRPYELFAKEFPELEILRLPGYTILYPRERKMVRGIIAQSPRILWSAISEHRSLRELIRRKKIDAVISDNRFGLFSRRIPSIYLTHQISISMPTRLRWLAGLVRHMHRLAIERYTECWIPDFAGAENLSGSLSHGCPLPVNASFVGPLSRFRRGTGGTEEFEVIAVLSGPEPQRTIFEEKVVEQLKSFRAKSLIIRGMPELTQRMRISDSLTVISHLDSSSLCAAIRSSTVVIARPGYSTLMDLAVLGKPAILVPTPGQTEQEYLAEALEEQGRFVIQNQNSLSIETAFKEAVRRGGYGHLPPTEPLLTDAVNRLITLAKARRSGS